MAQLNEEVKYFFSSYEISAQSCCSRAPVLADELAKAVPEQDVLGGYRRASPAFPRNQKCADE
jgi:hypothetical protein